MDEIDLTAEQELEAREIEDMLKAKMAVESRQIARLLALKSNRELFGAVERQVSDELKLNSGSARETRAQRCGITAWRLVSQW